MSIARRISRGALSAEEALEAHIGAVERTHGAINAVVARRFEAARREARAADAAVKAGDELAPLHGVPITIKESFAVEGMPNTAGLVARRGMPAYGDATTVARLRRAGAVIMGVTNVSELCMWMESNNFVYGRTNNPYDHGRIAGGSSGGEGAVVGAGASPIGLGADIGGSIRLPAFFCGRLRTQANRRTGARHGPVPDRRKRSAALPHDRPHRAMRRRSAAVLEDHRGPRRRRSGLLRHAHRFARRRVAADSSACSTCAATA